MQGTVTRIRKMGVEAQMNASGTPTGQFNVVRQSDHSVACVVTLRKRSTGSNVWKFNWIGAAPTILPAIGDSLQPVG